MVAELRAIIGDDIELELIRYDPEPPEPDMGLFDTLAGILYAKLTRMQFLYLYCWLQLRMRSTSHG